MILRMDESDMKNKGRRHKRAVDALRKYHLDNRYTKGCVLSVTKKHPNYFTAIIFDSWNNMWELHYCGYISAYMNTDGTFVKAR